VLTKEIRAAREKIEQYGEIISALMVQREQLMRRLAISKEIADALLIENAEVRAHLGEAQAVISDIPGGKGPDVAEVTNGLAESDQHLRAGAPQRVDSSR
jgi:phytoene/squalene synthetase